MKVHNPCGDYRSDRYACLREAASCTFGLRSMICLRASCVLFMVSAVLCSDYPHCIHTLSFFWVKLNLHRRHRLFPLFFITKRFNKIFYAAAIMRTAVLSSDIFKVNLSPERSELKYTRALCGSSVSCDFKGALDCTRAVHSPDLYTPLENV